MEQWKDIKGYEGLYQVSNYGNIKRLERFGYNEKILSKSKDKNGYNLCTIFLNKKRITIRIGRIEAFAFLEGDENKKEVNHKDGDRANDMLWNLELVSRSENILHSYRELNRKPPWLGKFGKDNPNAKQVNQYDLDGFFIKNWGSVMDIKKNLGYDNSFICKVCNGKINSAYGFLWKYI